MNRFKQKMNLLHNLYAKAAPSALLFSFCILLFTTHYLLFKLLYVIAQSVYFHRILRMRRHVADDDGVVYRFLLSEDDAVGDLHLFCDRELGPEGVFRH